jgi:hypothetical protein
LGVRVGRTSPFVTADVCNQLHLHGEMNVLPKAIAR